MFEYIYRGITPRIEKAVKFYPVITITGPRQAGKSTLCRHMFPNYRYVNLESIAERALAQKDPKGFLDGIGDKVVIDEVQYVPQLLSEIQVRVDRDSDRRYILTGSSNFSLLHSIPQSLAGRTALFTLLPFAFNEVAEYAANTPTDCLIFNGFYPRVLVQGYSPDEYYDNYYTTYVERDLRDLLRVQNLLKFDTFVRLLALRVGSEFNASAMSREVGVSSTTISEWLSLLVTSYIAFELPPYFSNAGKSLTKQKKIYFYDTGLLCNLLAIRDSTSLAAHPLRGHIFENLAVAAYIKSKLIESNRPDAYYYRENRGVEVDLVAPMSDGGLQLYEIKASKTIHADYDSNMKKLASQLTIPTRSTVIYDGTSYPPAALNIRAL